jgi:hypothetical protein
VYRADSQQADINTQRGIIGQNRGHGNSDIGFAAGDCFDQGPAHTAGSSSDGYIYHDLNYLEFTLAKFIWGQVYRWTY